MWELNQIPKNKGREKEGILVQTYMGQTQKLYEVEKERRKGK